eukprot:7116707-Prymnesium_polylepis.1
MTGPHTDASARRSARPSDDAWRAYRSSHPAPSVACAWRCRRCAAVDAGPRVTLLSVCATSNII